MAQPHVCLLCTQHVAGNVRITGKLGAVMAEAGFRVTWVGPDLEPAPEGYDGIDFRFYRSPQNRLRRIFNTHRAERLAATVDDVDVYFAGHPDTARSAARLAQRTGARAALDLHEIYHEDQLNRWSRGLAKRTAGRIIHRWIAGLLDRMDLVVYSGDSVLAPYPNVKSPAVRARNAPLRAFADGPPADVLPRDGGPITIMHGKASLSRGTKPILLAAAEATKRLGRLVRVLCFPVFAPHEHFGEVELRALAASTGVPECLDLRQPVPFRRMPDLLRQCDLGALMFPPEHGAQFLPCRLFEYMALGIPVLYPPYCIEIRELVEAERCGVACDPRNPQAIAEVIVNLCGDPDKARGLGRRGREAFLARCNFNADAQPILDWLRQCVPDRGGV